MLGAVRWGETERELHGIAKRLAHQLIERGRGACRRVQRC